MCNVSLLGAIPANFPGPFPLAGYTAKHACSAPIPSSTTQRVCVASRAFFTTIRRATVTSPARTTPAVVPLIRGPPDGAAWRHCPASCRACGATGPYGGAREPSRPVTPAIPDKAVGVGPHKLPQKKDSWTRARTFKKRSARVNFKAPSKRPTAQHVPTIRYFM